MERQRRCNNINEREDRGISGIPFMFSVVSTGVQVLKKKFSCKSYSSGLLMLFFCTLGALLL